MKKFNKPLLYVLAAAAAFSLMGCGSSASDSGAYYSDYEGSYAKNAVTAEAAAYTDDLYDYDYEDDGDAFADAAAYDNSAESSSASMADAEVTAASKKRKLIKTVNISAQTKEFDKLIANVTGKIESLGGYAETLDISGVEYNASSYSTRHAYIVARIPSDKLDLFVSSVAESSNITSKNESVSDVTLQYSDVEAHKESLKVEQERLNELLKEADSLETVIALEERLTEVRYELESYESRLRSMDNQVDYGTVDLNISEVKDYTPAPIESKTFGQRLLEGFLEGCESAVTSLGDFIVGFVTAFPVILVILFIIAVIAGVIFLIVRLIITIVKRGSNKKAKKAQLKAAGKDNAAIKKSEGAPEDKTEAAAEDKAGNAAEDQAGAADGRE